MHRVYFRIALLIGSDSSMEIFNAKVSSNKHDATIINVKSIFMIGGYAENEKSRSNRNGVVKKVFYFFVDVA